MAPFPISHVNTCANAITWPGVCGWGGDFTANRFGAIKATRSHNGTQTDTPGGVRSYLELKGCLSAALCSRIDLKLNVNRGEYVSVTPSESQTESE